MINVQHEVISSIPCLTVTLTEQSKEPLPTLLYFHGFTSAKEHNLPIAYLLAESGYRVILPDSMLHGERDVGCSDEERQLSFWNIILHNVKEITFLHEDLNERELIAGNRFGVAGTSMGGITTSAAITAHPWIKTGAIFMGSPNITGYATYLINGMKQLGKLPISELEIEQLLKQLAEVDLAKFPEKIAGRPLFFWHGEKDSVIPFEYSYRFYKELKANEKQAGPVSFVKEAKQDHKVSRYAILKGVEWMKKYL